MYGVNFSYLKFLGLVAVVGVSLNILRKWRVGVVVFFIWIVFEDLIRKFSGNSMVIYFVKDFIILLTYFSFFTSILIFHKEEKEKFVNPIKIPLALFTGLVIICSFNPNLNNWLIPLTGVRLWMIYIPLFYVGYMFFNTEKQIMIFLTITIVLATGVAFLGLSQASVNINILAPEEIPYNLTKLDDVRKYGYDYEVWRPPSVFVSPGRFANYALVYFLISFGSIPLFISKIKHIRKNNFFVRLILLIPFFTLTLVTFSSGSRKHAIIVLFILSIFTIMFLVSRLFLNNITSPIEVMKIAVIIVPVFILIVYSPIMPQIKSTSVFLKETINTKTGPSEMEMRMSSYWDNIFVPFRETGIIGTGTGSHSQGLVYLTKNFGEDRYVTESGFGTIIVEFGLVGIIVWIWLFGSLIKNSISTLKILRGTRLYGLGLSISIFIIVVFLLNYFGNVYQDYIIGIHLWFLSGLLFKLPSLKNTMEYS